MALINNMIRNRRFNEFTGEMVRIQNEESEDRHIWEIWLHRIFDTSFKDFFNMAKGNSQRIPTAASTQPSSEELEDVVRNSVNILDGFCLS